ncbi:class IV adenylate cyclase [Candidatus Pacearchaeota archaeon]|nr:class IV adenylate cyclase [Candidatus Pacearchaeota archaeon]
MWYEVESKIKINDYNLVKKEVRRIANFKKKDKKTDKYFALHINGYPKRAFRIRFEGKKYIVNFKNKIDRLGDGISVVKEEFEFSLGSDEEMNNFLSLCKNLGFKEWIDKKKINETYCYKKNKKLSIELNKVEHLGNWMEIEYLGQRKEISKAKKIIKDVLSQIKRGLGEVNNTGYTKMLYARRSS